MCRRRTAAWSRQPDSARTCHGTWSPRRKCREDPREDRKLFCWRCHGGRVAAWVGLVNHGRRITAGKTSAVSHRASTVTGAKARKARPASLAFGRVAGTASRDRRAWPFDPSAPAAFLPLGPRAAGFGGFAVGISPRG